MRRHKGEVSKRLFQGRNGQIYTYCQFSIEVTEKTLSFPNLVSTFNIYMHKC